MQTSLENGKQEMELNAYDSATQLSSFNAIKNRTDMFSIGTLGDLK